MSNKKELIEYLRAKSLDDKTISEQSRAVRRKFWDRIESNINEATRLGHSISLFDMIGDIDCACHYSEDDENEISNSNTISPEHTSDNCCEEMKAVEEEMIVDIQGVSEESEARDEEMIAIRQKCWEEMDADREERMAKLQEMSADIEVDLPVENIVPCDNFEVPNVLVEHTLNESNMEVNQDVTSEGLTDNSSVAGELESDYTETTLLGPSSSYLGKVEYLDSASDCSEDNRNEISSNNTISLEHTSGTVSYTHLYIYI